MHINDIFDQSAFLIAIGFAAAALAVTTLTVWLGSRTHRYLLYWGAGLSLGVPSVVLLAAFMEPYDPTINFIAFAFLLAAAVLVQASGTEFRRGSINVCFSSFAWLLSMLVVGIPFAIGLSGVGVIALNVAAGVLFLATGWEFWRARRETPGLLLGMVTAYTLLGLSFFLCVIPIIQNGQYVLHARQENWAEDINSCAIIFSMAIIGALMLVTAQSRTTHRHRLEARRDPLTGLLNRRAIFETVELGGTDLGNAAIMFDLDHFKRVNDRFGHAKGDEILVRFAGILMSRIRSTDLAARLGGEEFCILMHAATADAAHDVAERIRAALEVSEPLSADAGPPTVSAGIGFRVSPTAFEKLLRDADKALYAAKAAGRNRVHGPLSSAQRLVA